MPNVPTYTPKAQLQDVPRERMDPTQPIEAFGGGKANPFGAVSQVAGQLNDFAQKEVEKAAQVEFQNADTKLSEAQTRIQVESGKMLGRDAGGAPDYANEEWKKAVDEVGMTLHGPARRAFNASVGNRWESLNRGVSLHVADQISKTDDLETQSYIDSSRTSARVNSFDDQAIGQETTRIRDAVTAWAGRKGLLHDKDGAESPVFKDKLTDELSLTHAAVIESRLAIGKPELAKSYFDKAKAEGEISSKHIGVLEKNIEDAQILGVGLKTWDKVRGIRLSDGQFDEDKMRRAVLSSTDLPDNRKEKVWEFVKARMGESIVSEHRADNARNNSFMNTVLGLKKQGQPMAEAMKVVKRFSKDNYDENVKMDALKKLYNPPRQGDPIKETELWLKIKDGGGSYQELDQQMRQGSITPEQWQNLTKLFHESKTNPLKEDEKFTWDRVVEMADEKFGSNKNEKSKFLISLRKDTSGQAPAQIFKKAEEMLPKGGFLGFNKTKPYKEKLAQQDADSRAWATAYDDVGKDQISGIIGGVTRSGKPKATPMDIKAFADEMGGYDKIKIGTPANNAIQSLTRRRMPVTPANIKAVLQKVPSGVY